MGCTKCTHYSEDSEYGDYGTCYGTWYECSVKPHMANLKSFPFQQVPKSCRGVFQVDKEQLSGRGHEVMSQLCDSVCARSTDHEIRYHKEHGCSIRSCEAFRYIEGRTDLWQTVGEIMSYSFLSEEKVREALQGKKLSFRDTKGRKHDFQIVNRETCSACLGNSATIEKGFATWICDACKGSGVQVKEVTNP